MSLIDWIGACLVAALLSAVIGIGIGWHLGSSHWQAQYYQAQANIQAAIDTTNQAVIAERAKDEAASAKQRQEFQAQLDAVKKDDGAKIAELTASLTATQKNFARLQHENKDVGAWSSVSLPAALVGLPDSADKNP